jgi:hypothetical protein
MSSLEIRNLLWVNIEICCGLRRNSIFRISTFDHIKFRVIAGKCHHPNIVRECSESYYIMTHLERHIEKPSHPKPRKVAQTE